MNKHWIPAIIMFSCWAACGLYPVKEVFAGVAVIMQTMFIVYFERYISTNRDKKELKDFNAPKYAGGYIPKSSVMSPPPSVKPIKIGIHSDITQPR